jgi:hypothetical protein
VAVGLFVFVMSAGAQEGAAGPVQNDAAGRQAWDLLGEFYKADNDGADLDGAVATALKETSDADIAKAGATAGLLIALFRQADADERNGRAEWKRSPAWGGGADSKARDFRERLAGGVGESAFGRPGGRWTRPETIGDCAIRAERAM